jgi:hypothetical protein
MRSNQFLFVGGELFLYFQEQLLIGKMRILILHKCHRSAERAMRARDRASESETAPSDISRIPAISR